LLPNSVGPKGENELLNRNSAKNKISCEWKGRKATDNLMKFPGKTYKFSFGKQNYQQLGFMTLNLFSQEII